MKKNILITVVLLIFLTLVAAACGKDSGSPGSPGSEDESAKKPLIDKRGDSARESINKYVGTALHVKDSATKQVEASKERQRMMEALDAE